MEDIKTALVLGAGGFIGSHMVKRLKDEGFWVRGVDLKEPEFSSSEADDFVITDLRHRADVNAAFFPDHGPWDRVYQLAADMGGMGFIENSEYECLTNNAIINLNCISAASYYEVGTYFFSSSVCIYPDMHHGDPEMTEDQAYPAMPDNEYGWEKLYAERVALSAAKRRGLRVRIARFQNCYGPEGAWRGGREKAPAALCRKIAEATNTGEIEVWGDGTAVRNFIYIDDLIEAVQKLIASDIEYPVNIGTREYVTVDELIDKIEIRAGKRPNRVYIAGPVGVESRNFSNSSIESLGWSPLVSIEEGLGRTYDWIADQVCELDMIDALDE